MVTIGILDYFNGTTAALFIFTIGIYGLIARRNILKSIISISVIQSAIILFFVDVNPGDPLVESLMITAVVIGVSVSAVALMLFIHLYHVYGTTSWWRLMRKRSDKI
ncbi:MAG: NADH-quinone oxidoreductase subunit K [Clostridia bacterium]|jgi:multicomponent Na+:H+ antiporter subunit C|nr:NADH-quinone oxidoreductase subunit K [Clostridia bacterium]